MMTNNEACKENDGVSIHLNEYQALVLFEWLAKFNEQESHESIDQSEQRVLFDLESLLEEKLTATFEPNYQELVERARRVVCGENGVD